MLLEPGPLPQLDASWYPTTYDAPDFEAMTVTAFNEADSILNQMDALFDPLAVFDEALSGDTIMADLNEADQINGDNAHLVNLSGQAIGDQMKADGDTALILAIQNTPGEAWQPVPAALYAAGTAPPQPTAKITGVALANPSGGDPQTYVEGDQFQLVVRLDTTTGNAADYFNVLVYAELTQDQIQQPDLTLGRTDHTGTILYKGQWSDTDAGHWTMFIHAQPTTGGDVISQLYQWTVQGPGGATGGGRQQAVTVQLQNLTSLDVNDNAVGDNWRLTVRGPINEPVYTWATHNGQSLGENQLGSTDGAGTFVLDGVFDVATVGDWVESYAVGRFNWTGNLVFSVTPAPKPGRGPGQV